MRFVMKRVIRGSVGNIDTGTLCIADLFREGMNLIFGGKRVLGVGASKRVCSEDPVARFYLLDAFADGFNYASRIRTRRVGKRGFDRVCSGAHISVVRIDSGGVDAHEDLSPGGFRRWDFFQLELFGPAEGVNSNCFHRALLKF